MTSSDDVGMSRLRIFAAAVLAVTALSGTLTACGNSSGLPGIDGAKPPAQQGNSSGQSGTNSGSDEDTDQPTSGQDAKSKYAPKVRPCELLTDKEAEELLGAAVVRDLDDESHCRYARKDGKPTLPDKGIMDAGQVYFDMAFDANGANDVKPAFEFGSKPDNKVPNLGQDAHFLGTLLYVLVNDHLSFSVSLLVGHPEDKRKEISLEIAKRALDRLK